MTDLATESHDDGAPVLDEQQAAELEGEIGPWTRNGVESLEREFEFADFTDAFGFVARVALVAERFFHHPDVELGWGRVALKLTSHSAGGLTRNDFIMAARIDGLLEQG